MGEKSKLTNKSKRARESEEEQSEKERESKRLMLSESIRSTEEEMTTTMLFGFGPQPNRPKYQHRLRDGEQWKRLRAIDERNSRCKRLGLCWREQNEMLCSGVGLFFSRNMSGWRS